MSIVPTSGVVELFFGFPLATYTTNRKAQHTPARSREDWFASELLSDIMFGGKYNLDIKDFGPSWRDGVAFNAIVHSINPDLVDMREVANRSNRENLHRAFSLAEEELGIPKLLDPEASIEFCPSAWLPVSGFT
ncbi:unnamed protein product [Dibothriocephalus latus]|uniref:Calponin-homology (CH) domain-containing protein n=1 Tax=Dibothriocephalus latus TaxID=60516 RepID=A0A3P7LBE2_DIBLA|nr:unnamed protein product [Dibothriocephalus latus]